MKLEIGKKYKWKHRSEVLSYIGEKGGWHQFTLNSKIWCEVLDSDLWMMEIVE